MTIHSQPAHTTLHGPLGDAIAASRTGRLFHFITDETSPAIAIFDPARVATNTEGDWYGEHAGKWLAASAKAAARSGDTALQANVARVADHLCDLQEADGYLGNYAPSHRFMVKQPPKPGTWDGAPSVRTWDIWTHSYLVLGLLEAHAQQPHPRWLAAARRIGDLCIATLVDGDIDINELGNHHGMSATVLMDPAVELYRATGDERYLALAKTILAQADANPALALVSRAEAGVDAFEIATGKAYQLAWNLVGLAKLHRATGDPVMRDAVERLWRSIREHHLSLGGGPWGGAGLRSRECFNPPFVFSPHGYVETCSTLAWIQLNRELLAITGEAVYAEEIERSAWNDLLGALAPNGEDWCYYSFANGQRVHTTYWRCCKSSGAMALEELPAIACSVTGAAEISVNLLGPQSAVLMVSDVGAVRLDVQTAYPFEGVIAMTLAPPQPAALRLRVRVPSWAQGASVAIDGTVREVTAGEYAVIDRVWSPGDRLTLSLPMTVQLHRRVNFNVQESKAPDGSPVAQQVLHTAFAAITRGPLVYASGLIDGYKPDEVVRLPETDPHDWLEMMPTQPGDEGAAIRMHLEGRAPLTFVPYYRTGGRVDGAWRVTWLQLAPTEKIP